MVDDHEISGGVVHDLPADLTAALKRDAEALTTWQDITPLARNEWICWVTSAKKAETREKRIRWAAKASAKASAVPAADKAHSCKALIACCTTEVA